jgi:hypothetical protein
MTTEQMDWMDAHRSDSLDAGTLVDYHGSMIQRHGEWYVIGIDHRGYEDNNGPRYILSRDYPIKFDGDVIQNVRRQSFSIVGEEISNSVTVSLPKKDWESIIVALEDNDDWNEWSDKLSNLADEIRTVVYGR